ncbi:MAG: hypothetical protein ACE14T_02920 [Syntrophales bacterium]
MNRNSAESSKKGISIKRAPGIFSPRHFFRFLSFLSFLPLLLGMGVLGESPADRIPKTEKKFMATFIDDMDVITDCRELSIDGNTYLEGKRGEGTVAIPFDRIKSVLFRLKNGNLEGLVRLNDGSEVVLSLNKDRKAYGWAKYGAFQIKLSNLKKLIISPMAAGEKK